LQAVLLRFQAYEPLAKYNKDCNKCQGTTLVVPREQHIILGFSPCGFSVICGFAAAKAEIIVNHLRHD